MELTDHSPLDQTRQAAEFFHGFADTFDTLYGGKRSPWMRWIDNTFRSDIYIRYAKTFDCFGDLAQKSVLDIGCGSGPYVSEAFQRGASHVTAVDPAPRMLELVKDRLTDSGFATRCSYVLGSFPVVDLAVHDHAIVMGVMDYVADAPAFLNALRPLVGISAALSFPSIHWFRTPVRQIRYRLRNCPLFFYDEEAIRDLCTRAGFSQVIVDKIPGAGQDYHVCLRP